MSELITGSNVFEEVITAEAVRDILSKQVAKAREGDTGAANLVLKIALAKSGKDQSSRKNPATPVAKSAITKGQLLAILSHESLPVPAIARRTGCSPESITAVLDSDRRFVCDIRGTWSLENARIA